MFPGIDTNFKVLSDSIFDSLAACVVGGYVGSSVESGVGRRVGWSKCLKGSAPGLEI